MTIPCYPTQQVPPYRSGINGPGACPLIHSKLKYLVTQTHPGPGQGHNHILHARPDDLKAVTPTRLRGLVVISWMNASETNGVRGMCVLYLFGVGM